MQLQTTRYENIERVPCITQNSDKSLCLSTIRKTWRKNTGGEIKSKGKEEGCCRQGHTPVGHSTTCKSLQVHLTCPSLSTTIRLYQIYRLIWEHNTTLLRERRRQEKEKNKINGPDSKSIICISLVPAILSYLSLDIIISLDIAIILGTAKISHSSWAMSLSTRSSTYLI